MGGLDEMRGVADAADALLIGARTMHYQLLHDPLVAEHAGLQMKAIGGQPDYALGSVHAVTRDGTLVIASASGSQLASYAWGAANVIFVVGAQKLVPTCRSASSQRSTFACPATGASARASMTSWQRWWRPATRT